MKFIYLFPLAPLLLCGCDVDSNNHGYGYDFDQFDPETGIRVQYQESAFQYPLDKIIQAYIEVQECTGIWADGPMIVIIDYKTHDNPEFGIAFFHPPLIVVTDWWFKANVSFTLKHEFVHYLLLMNGMSDIQNSNHESSFFTDCAPFS